MSLAHRRMGGDRENDKRPRRHSPLRPTQHSFKPHQPCRGACSEGSRTQLPRGPQTLPQTKTWTIEICPAIVALFGPCEPGDPATFATTLRPYDPVMMLCPPRAHTGLFCWRLISIGDHFSAHRILFQGMMARNTPRTVVPCVTRCFRCTVIVKGRGQIKG